MPTVDEQRSHVSEGADLEHVLQHLREGHSQKQGDDDTESAITGTISDASSTHAGG